MLAINTPRVVISSFLRSALIVNAIKTGATMAAERANTVTNNPTSEVDTPKSTAIISITPVIIYSMVPIRKTASARI
ncbi:hypothetical protein D3C81_2052290 [compost metagenome]